MKKLNGLDKYVIFSIVLLLVYTIIEFVAASITGISHDTLTTCFFAAFAGEVLSCALIKVFKLHENGEHLEFYKDEDDDGM